jgi:HK97 family phage portal protein
VGVLPRAKSGVAERSDMVLNMTSALSGLWSSRARRSDTAKSVGPLIAFEGLAAPDWLPRDYASLARHGLQSNPIVYRAIRLVAEAVSSVPLVVLDGELPASANPLSEVLARPNADETRIDVMDAIVTGLLISGSAFLHALAVDGRVRAIYVLRPDRVRAIAGADGWPAGFEYRTADGVRLLNGDVVPGVAKVLQLRLRHPLSDTVGLAPVEAAASAIDVHNTASRWNKALLDNSARPSGALVYTADQSLSPEQFQRLKDELQESFQGARNTGRPMLLEGGLDWKSMSLSPRDMDFIEAKHVAAREIALAIGVPPMLLGIPGDNTYSNYREANRTFWHQTVIPLADRIAAGVTRWLQPAFGETLRIAPDTDRLDALSGARDSIWARLETSTFLTINEKRAALGYSALPDGDRF